MIPLNEYRPIYITITKAENNNYSYTSIVSTDKGATNLLGNSCFSSDNLSVFSFSFICMLFDVFIVLIFIYCHWSLIHENQWHLIFNWTFLHHKAINHWAQVRKLLFPFHKGPFDVYIRCCVTFTLLW